MKSHPVFLVLIGIIFCGVAYAGTRGEIVLSDGSVVYGEIRSVSDGVYTIESSTMGQIKIDQSKIRTIRFGADAVGKPTSKDMPKMDMHSELRGIEKSIMGNQEILNIIETLQDDPEFQKILNDPTVMNSVLAGDIQSLMMNPEFQKLLNHPKVEEIRQKMAK